MIIELSTGKYLHTAYSITNIPEEMTTLDNEWSLTSQDGMDYIGTFIDGSSTESTDPNDYAWEELIDEDLEDEDEDGDIPIDDFQTQIDELQDQITVNQDNIRSINASIENVQTNVASNSELSSATADIANATNQHFWTDENGVHVSNEEANAEGERNTIFNSIGMIFRKGANYLTAILAGGASGTDPKGLAIYDGQGNSDENVVASFTDGGSVIGKYGGSRTIVGNNYISMINSEGVETFRINNAGGNKYQQEVNESYFIYVNKQRPQTATLFNNAIPPDGESFGIDGLRSDGSGASPSIDFNFWFYAGTPETKSQTFTLNNGNGTITIAYDGSRGIEVSLSATEEFDALITKTSFVVFSDAPAFTLGSRTKNQQMGANSLTVGTDLYTDAQNSVVVGQYNAGTTGVSFFTVGCGTSDDVSERANALDVRGYGSFNETVITGVLEVRKRQYKNLDTGGDILAEGNITANNHVVGITETGTTSNGWDYRLWSDGTYEAWRSHGFTGMTLTSSSAGTYYGNGTTLGVPIFPNNGNTGVLQCLCSANGAFSHSSGVYLYQVLHSNATTATADMTFQFRAHASTSNAACGIDIYLKGTYA